MFLDFIAGFLRSLLEEDYPPSRPNNSTSAPDPQNQSLTPEKMVQKWVAESLSLEPESWRLVDRDTFQRGDFSFEIHESSNRVYRPEYLDCPKVKAAVEQWVRTDREKRIREQAIKDLDKLARAHQPKSPVNRPE